MPNVFENFQIRKRVVVDPQYCLSTTQEKYPGAKDFRNFTKLPKTDPIFPIFRRYFLVGFPYEQEKESKIAKILQSKEMQRIASYTIV